MVEKHNCDLAPVEETNKQHALSFTETVSRKIDSRALRYLRLMSGKLFKLDGSHSCLSDDGGKTWRKGVKVNPYNIGATGDLNQEGLLAIQIQNSKHAGRIIIPFYIEMDGEHPDYSREEMGAFGYWKGERIMYVETHTYVPEVGGAFMCYSDDEGESWKASKGFLLGYFNDGFSGIWSCEEPSVAELKDGRLLCFIRSTTGRILKSYSADGGEYWYKVQATNLACSNSPPVLKKIPQTGDLVLVWNQVSADEIRRGYRRGRLSLAISKDDGETWINFKTLELVKGLDRAVRIEPEPLQAMIRGPRDKGNLLDGFVYYHYPEVYFNGDRIYIEYSVGTLKCTSSITRREFPVSWLYQE